MLKIVIVYLFTLVFVNEAQENVEDLRPSEQECYHLTTNIIDFIGVENLDTTHFHMAAVGWKGKEENQFNYACGGTLIAVRFVLTVAHCTSSDGVPPDVVLIGGEILNVPGFAYRTIPIVEIHKHPLYRRRQVYHDIAILRMNISTYFVPSCLWTENIYNHSSVTVLGYGNTKFEGSPSRVLVSGKLQIVPNDQCKKDYSPRYKLEKGLIDSQICAGDYEMKQDTCQGDSGGPLMIVEEKYNKSRPFVIGITSYGLGCAIGAPGVYTRVYSYLDWIESIVWPEKYEVYTSKRFL